MTAVAFLDAASVFVFALTGALAASRAQLDIVGFLFFSSITAVGGGTVRDLLLDRNPVFWIARPEYLAIAAAAAILVYFTHHLVDSRARWLAWLDACALSIAVPTGLVVSLSVGQGGIVAPIMGVITGTLGGLMRDVVANEVPMVLRQGELYVTAAFAGAVAGWLAGPWIGAAPALLLAAGVTFALRAGSLAFGWQLPSYRARPPR